MIKSIQELVPGFIREISPYEPGKPVEEVERELKLQAVKLASNENPLGSSPLAIEAAHKALAEANRYPDGGGYYLRKKLAARLDVEMDQILLGGGSTELIDIAARTLLNHGDEGVTSAGSFPMYYISIRAAGARLVEVPLRDFAFDLEAIARAVTPHTKLVYLANPNNPTGTMFTADALDAFLGRMPSSVVVVLDEAYYEYVERPNYSRSVESVRRGRNLVVLRTFSKVYGLAGMRIGYAIGPVALLEEMNKVRSPFNTSGVAQAAALAALDDAAHVRRSIESNRAGLQQLGEGLAAQGVGYVPSAGNFVLVLLNSEAKPVADALLQLGLIVRPMRWMGFPNAIRVTVGTREENERFLSALAEVRPAVTQGVDGARPGAAGERVR
ncbi:MAG TPA: histidinol-phosphate transaminase [Candidatus Acidoferrales bacterium]|jgi:histidinol-phosphate aminotransferase|nr:histidinol-phosphate transaminase [Candidatus Acidoferrales bacterium]